MKRLLHSLASSLILATMLFTVIRLSHDLTIGEDYWDIHSRAFILTELLMTWGYSLIAVICTPLLISFGNRHQLPPASEYLISALFACICALSAIVVSHRIDPGPTDFTQIVLPLTETILFTCLYYSYCRGTERDRRLSRQLLTIEKTRSEQLATELRLLRSQYHPHFLFNMLNTIYVQIDEGNEAPRHTIECLSEVLRYQLYSPEQPVEAADETAVMEKYIELCTIRCSRQLILEKSVAPAESLSGIRIYPLLLIPLIENAFKYVGGAYRISISFGLSEGMLQLRVSNSLPPNVANASKPGYSGLGLENLRRRLSLLYPADSHSLLTVAEAGTFTATLRLKPLTKTEIQP